MKISFGSTYKIDQRQNISPNFADKLYEFYQNGVDIAEEPSLSKESKMPTTVLIAPDKLDKKIESILYSLGINFHKTNKKENLDLNNIKSRMVIQEDLKNTHELVEVDVQKLDKLLQLDKVSSLEQNSYDDRFEKFHNYLETGLNINSPTLIFCNDTEGIFGVHIEDGRHRFAVLRDMGMEKIPVAVPKKSLKFLKNFELI